MKRIGSVIAVALLAVCVARADDKDKAKSKTQPKPATSAKASKAKASSAEKESKESKVMLTGSYIPQNIRPGRITDGPSQLIVLDHDAIQRTGATTVLQALSRNGIH